MPDEYEELAIPKFDPYRAWLNIPPEEQPPNRYRLLGLRDFENDRETIEAAADRLMVHVRSFQHGKHSAATQQLLNELAAARICLTNPERKTEYDESLRAESRAAEEPPPPAKPPAQPPQPGPPPLQSQAEARAAMPIPVRPQPAQPVPVQGWPSAGLSSTASGEATATAAAPNRAQAAPLQRAAIKPLGRPSRTPLWQQPIVLAAAGGVAGLILLLLFAVPGDDVSRDGNPGSQAGEAEVATSKTSHTASALNTKAEQGAPKQVAHREPLPFPAPVGSLPKRPPLSLAFGRGDGIEVLNTQQYFDAAKQCTVEMWVELIPDQSQHDLAAVDSGARPPQSNTWTLSVRRAPEPDHRASKYVIILGYIGTHGRWMSQGGTFPTPDGQQHHVALVSDQIRHVVFVDGHLVINVNRGNAGAAAANLTLGNVPGSRGLPANAFITSCRLSQGRRYYTDFYPPFTLEADSDTRSLLHIGKKQITADGTIADAAGHGRHGVVYESFRKVQAAPGEINR